MDSQLVPALRILARDIYCEDGIATACIAEAANEIERLRAENADYRREVREQRLEIAGLREERAALLQADRTPGADATPDECSVRSAGRQDG